MPLMGKIQAYAHKIYYSIGGGFIVTDEEFSLIKMKAHLHLPFLLTQPMGF